MTTKTIETLRTTVAQAITAFDGIDWDSGPSQVVSGLEAALKIAQKADPEDGLDAEQSYRMRSALARAAEPEAGCWWLADGSYEAQALRRRWDSLLESIPSLTTAEEIEAALAEAQALAEAEGDHVTDAAETAREHGEVALAAAESGDWGEAEAEAAQAVLAEAQFGDAPAWRPVLDMIRELTPDVVDADGEQVAQA